MFINYSEEIDEKLKEESKRFEPLPVENTYEIRISSVSELKDDRGYMLEFLILSPQEFNKRKLWKNIYLKSKDNNEKTNNILLGMFRGFLEQIGLDKDARIKFFAEELNSSKIRSLLDGKILTVRLKNKPLNGNIYQEISKVISCIDDKSAF